MSKLHRFVLAISLVPLVSFMASGRGEAAGCTKNEDCDDNDPCTKDKCDEDTAQCEFKPHDFGNHYGQPIACDDGNACTDGDVCHAGVCAGVNVADGTACTDPVTCAPDVCEAGACGGPDGDPRTVIVFASGRDNPAAGQLQLEIYLMDEDFTNSLRLTSNTNADSMPALSPDGRGRIVFDSNRMRIPGVERPNTSDLFLMKDDGSLQTFLVRGSSATWSPDSRSIAFHRSASGTAPPIGIPDLGAPTTDSDIFVATVCDLVAGLPPTNITNSAGEIDDDASWSPDGQKILWTAHDDGDAPLVRPSQDIYVMNADGSGRVNLTDNSPVEERGPAWSPDGTRIVYMCRVGDPATPTSTTPTFEICVMNSDGSDSRRLTHNTLPDGTPTWSPDGTRILFNRAVPPPNQQLHIMNADGSEQTQVTFPPGFNLFASFGEVEAEP